MKVSCMYFRRKYSSNKNCLSRKKTIFLVFFIILFLTVGYSSLGTTLSLSGQIFVKVDKIAPTVEYSVLGGSYNNVQTITIKPIDDESGVSYYSIFVYKDGVILNSYEDLKTESHDVVLDEVGTYEIRTFVVDKFNNEIEMEPIIDGMYYQTYLIDKEKPILTVTPTTGNYETSTNVTLTVQDTGGSELSSDNIYKYCLSESSTEATDCTWTDYTSGTAFSISGTNQTKYLWVYPVKDNSGNVNDSKTFGTAYLIGTYKFDSTAPTLAVSVTANGRYMNVKLMAEDTGGSNLSHNNVYKYCLSTSSSSVTGCTWTEYSNGTTYTISETGTRYLFVYPIKDNSGNVNDSKIFGTPYMMTTISFCSTIPTYTYTGSHQLIDNGNGNWQIKFLTDGTFTLTNTLCTPIDAFLVGGGGGGGRNGGGGGGGGYTVSRAAIAITKGTAYNIVVGHGGAGGASENAAGSNGGATTAFSITANGGKGGGGYSEPRRYGGAGGSGGGGGGNVGGAGGVDGGNGGNGAEAVFNGTGGLGQGTSTREFYSIDYDKSAKLYASGGRGTGSASGAANTGNGGDGTVYKSGGYQSSDIHSGGSGIVIIRNSKVSTDKYTYTGSFEYIDDGNGNWRIKFLTSGVFTPKENMVIDAFLVGGGGGGGRNGGGGGGGGYTVSRAAIAITKGTDYNIVVGNGGAGGVSENDAGSNGDATTAFSVTANGGQGGGGYNDPRRYGGAGGSGGGGGGNVGGAGGVDGGNGGNGAEAVFNGTGGLGQGTSTREFYSIDYDKTAKLYASGGRGTGSASGAVNSGNGGDGTVYKTSNYQPSDIHAGGSGIVVIRNTR